MKKTNGFAAFARLMLAGALCLASLSVALAQAPLGFSLSPVGTATPGSTVRYFGTFTNLLTEDGDNLYISDILFGGDIINDDTDFVLDDSAFFENLPLFLTEDTTPGNEDEFYLTPGQQVMFEIFAVEITPTAAIGTLGTGDIDFAGGGPNAQDALLPEPATFSLTVAAPAVVPEAGSLALLLPALGMVGVIVARKRGAK